jgi:NSS family neurotransmitter:Na+ symporter
VTEGQRFSSRWGTMLVMLGMAVGTGNVWRFPRVAGSNGGGSFLIAWVVFLLLWSVPLILVEFAMGRETRRGPIGAFSRLVGEGFAWMGGWVAFTATAIMFYYAVVMGWTLRYLWGALAGSIPMTSPEAATLYWETYAGSGAALATHAVAIGLGGLVVAGGVRGIEKVVRVLVPALFLLILALAVRAVTLPGAERGLAFLFTPEWGDLLHARVWLEALTQNAWDTGAGWGLILAYAVYLRRSEDTTLNAFVLGFGNNTVSLLAGIMVLCTAFAILPDAADTIVGAGNEGLTFIWVPQLLAGVPGGRVFLVFFFLALFFAAWSSLIAMIELASRVLIDAGFTRRRAVPTVAVAGFLLGAPSALSMDVFRNQDWVWGVGLMLSGLFFALGVLRYGVEKFRTTLVNRAGSDLPIGRWWNVVIRLAVLEAVVLLVWWMSQAVNREDLWATFTPLSSFNVGTVLVQWAIVLVAFLALNPVLARRFAGSREPATDDGEDDAA